MEVSIRIDKTVRRLEGMEQFSLSDQDRQSLDYINQLLRQKVPELRHLASCGGDTKRKADMEYKVHYTSQDDEWILQMRSSFNEYIYSNFQIDYSQQADVVKKINLGDMISLMEDDLEGLKEKNSQKLNKLRNIVTESMEKEALFFPKTQDFEDPLADMKFKIPEEESYLSFLEKKQVEGKDHTKTEEADDKHGVSNKRPKVSIDDVVCQVCNDGDYTDEDLIVFCSV